MRIKHMTAVLSSFLLVSSASATMLDRTLATVNGEAILQSEFDKNADPVIEQFQKSSPAADQTPDRMRDLKKRVLDQMIDDRLLAQEAKKKNIHVSTLEVDEGVKKVRTRFTTDQEFNDELKKEGMSYEDFRKHIQDQIGVIKLIDQEVKGKTPPPTEAETRNLYDTLVAIINDKPVPGNHTASEVEELQSLAKAMVHRFGERIRARHILIRVDAHASPEERAAALKKIKDIQAQLKNGADFSELAKKYSEDPGSKDRGGDLGYFSHGDMVPAFEKVAFNTPVGQTSDIVTTEYGYHLIHVEEVKAASKMNFEDVKDDLKDYLFQQRAAKRFEDYVKGLHSNAEIKINGFN